MAPADVRFSRSSVNGVDEIAQSMRRDGWVGDPIDLVRAQDGSLTTLDNTRVLAAHQAGIDVRARVHEYDELLPDGSAERFVSRKGEVPTNFGEALENRIGRQNAGHRDRYPMGSPFVGRSGG